ncbi:MAG: 30S ribosomal protein S4, partial [Candidatus Woesearchaeota archaeon]|nr:30S ribosomal protein S4 [Candidatus Woesearchaeota archaeon]
MLKNFKDQAKNLIALSTPQAEKEKRQLIDKLKRYGLLKEDVQTLDPILDITLRDILERRLQTQVYKKGLARSINQARQFIVH